MKLPLRGPSASVEVQPRELRGSEDLEAIVTVKEAITDVASAELELGYVNAYRYHWAGRRDAAARHDDASLVTLGQVGTSYGSERGTEDWISVLKEPLPVGSGVLEAGTRAVRLRVPSWAPGSSEMVRWAVRLVVDRRKGRDVSSEGEFTVRVNAPAEAPSGLAPERVMGDSCDIDIQLERACWMAGERIRGTVVLTPRSDVPEADVAVLLQRRLVSHPLERSPASDYEYDGDRVTLDGHLTLSNGAPTELPFAIELPADAAPTAEAVHSSLDWFLQVRILYKGFSSHTPERVRHPFVVFNAR